MSEIAPTPAAPGSEAAPAAPAPVVTTPAPNQPAAPVTPAPTPQPAQPTTTATKDDAEDKEWEDAADELFPGLRSTQKKEGAKQDESAKSEKTPEEIAADEAAAKNQKPNAEQGPGDDTGAEVKSNEEGGDKPSNNAADSTGRDARNAARTYAQQVEAVRTDVMAKMYGEVPETLQDADGDPIRGIEDVMQLINPRTGKEFTEDEAGMWLLSAQQQFNQNRATIEKEAEQIAEVNLDVKDQADAINAKYGDYLKANSELRDELWADFQSTLVIDEKSGLITKAPVSLERFYERALSPRIEAETKAQADTEAKAAADAAAEQQAKEAAEKQRRRDRSDRSDIYAPNNQPDDDPEAKEWADAAREVFGPRN